MDRRNYDDFNRDRFNDDGGGRGDRPPYGEQAQGDPRYSAPDYGQAPQYGPNPYAGQGADGAYYGPQGGAAYPPPPPYPPQGGYGAPYGSAPYGAQPYPGEVTPFGGDANYAYAEEKKKRGFFSMFRRKDEESITGSDGSNIIITYPRSHQDVRVIIDNLRRRQAIIVDLSRLPDKHAQRILDFLSGAIYALCGSQQRIGPNMFLLTPGGMSIQVPIDIKKKYD